MYPQYKEASFRARQPIFVNKLLRKIPRQGTQPSSASYRGSFPCTTPRIPRYATGARFRGTVPNPSPASYPKLRGQDTSHPRHADVSATTVLSEIQPCRTVKTSAWSRPAHGDGYSY